MPETRSAALMAGRTVECRPIFLGMGAELSGLGCAAVERAAIYLLACRS